MQGGIRRSPVIIGRQEELARLRRTIAAAGGGAPATVFLVGEGGVGKTRLLTECLTEARRREVPVLLGRASAVSPAAFGVVAEALRSWLRTQPATPPEPSPFDAGLRLVLPEWPASGTGGLSDGQMRLLALEGVVHLVRRIAAGAGAAVVAVDDLHAADAESVEMIRYLAGAAVPGVVVLCALRAGEAAVAEEVANALGQAGVADVWPVVALTGNDVESLLGALLGVAPPTQLLDEVMARTDGVPLLVEETVEASLRAGSVTIDDAGAHWRGGASVVPRTAAAMVAGRLDRMDDAERDVIAAASIVGAGDVELLAITADQPVVVVRAALRTAVDHGLLETMGGVMQFRHAVIGDAVHELALPHFVHDVHVRAAAALAEDQSPTDITIERRARHLLAVGDHDAGASLLLEAAAANLATPAHLRAESLVRAAIDVARSGATRDAAHDALAEVLAVQGRWAESLELDHAAVASGRQTPERWMRMARCSLDARLMDVARSLADSAAELGDDSPHFEIMVGRLAIADGDAVTALARAEAALANAGDDGAAACGALDLKARALDFAGKRHDAAAAWTELIAVAERHGLTSERIRAVVTLSELELLSGQPPVKMYEAVELARRSGALVEEAWAELNLAIALIVQGELKAAARLAADAAARCRERRLDLLPFLLVVCAGSHRFFDEAASDVFLEEAIRLAGDSTDMQIHVGGAIGQHELAMGRYDGAIAHLEAATAATLAAPGGVPGDSINWLAIALIAAGRDDDAAAALKLAHDVPDLDRWYARSATLAAADALVARDAGRFDAVIASVKAPMPLDVATLQLAAADVIGGPSKARWIRAALDFYESAGAVVMLDRVRGLLRDAGGKVPRGRSGGRVPPHLVASGVTAREAEVLGLVGDGLSNAAIAESLYLSVRTVESHVSSLLAKLGATTRHDLAVAANTTANNAKSTSTIVAPDDTSR